MRGAVLFATYDIRFEARDAPKILNLSVSRRQSLIASNPAMANQSSSYGPRSFLGWALAVFSDG